ncbi:MAG: methyltransferase domain-containing protein [Frankiaceae bacterium]
MNLQAAGGPVREWDAATYDRVAHPQTRWGAEVLQRLELDGDETVLDAGCGSGRVTELLCARVPDGRIVALDASQDMLEAARRRLGSHSERIRFVHADLLDVTPEMLGTDLPVDAVFSTATFHWVTDHDRLFANLAGVLRPGGQLVAQCGAEGNIARLRAAVASLGVERVGTWHYAAADETVARLTAAGFSDVQAWTHEEPTVFEPGPALLDFLEVVCLREHLATLPADRRRPFVEAVAAAMPEPVIDYVRLNIVATRGKPPTALSHRTSSG